ncbi:MAG TPA: glyoxalase/bleomycin resistance/extradiol dioxygenase family protein [Microscillaceae bacterium]|nr:glyoxalase/bleomycin resistance/extradiol dioxygenase family protein [Microscillaceae bacterium]
MDQETQIVQINPVLPVGDMQESLDFYENKMGFKNVYDSSNYNEAGQELDYAVMCRQNCCIHLQLFKDIRPDFQPQIRIEVKNIEPLFEEYRSKGLLDNQPTLRETPWGTREFAFYDPNNMAITFFEGV